MDTIETNNAVTTTTSTTTSSTPCVFTIPYGNDNMQDTTTISLDFSLSRHDRILMDAESAIPIQVYGDVNESLQIIISGDDQDNHDEENNSHLWTPLNVVSYLSGMVIATTCSHVIAHTSWGEDRDLMTMKFILLVGAVWSVVPLWTASLWASLLSSHLVMQRSKVEIMLASAYHLIGAMTGVVMEIVLLLIWLVLASNHNNSVLFTLLGTTILRCMVLCLVTNKLYRYDI